MRLDVTFGWPVPESNLEPSRQYANALGLKRPQKMERSPLAVVGGGPSVKKHLDELRSWPGEVWIACGSFPWCRETGIDGVFFSADPQPLVADLAKGVRKALVWEASDPALFDALDGAEVEVFDLFDTPEDGANHGVSTVTAAPVLAAAMGHRPVSFFGCDSSFIGASHAYTDNPGPAEITVECGGDRYDTTLQLLAQAVFLAGVVRAAPHWYICRSGGLIAALTQNPEYDVVAASRALYMALTVDGKPYHEKYPPIPYSGA